MKNVSIWGKSNPKKARVIIASSHFLIVLFCAFLGFYLFVYEIKIPLWLTFALTNFFFIAYFLYPEKGQKKGFFKYSYIKQKSLDFILVVTYSFAIACALNQIAFIKEYKNVDQVNAKLIVHKVYPEVNLKPDKTSKSEIKKSIRNIKKSIKAEMKALKKEFKKRKDNGGFGFVQFLLVLLTLAAAIGLGWLVAALSCELSCSGQEGLAAAVLILGWGAIIWLGIIAFKKILKGGRKNKPKPAVND